MKQIIILLSNYLKSGVFSVLSLGDLEKEEISRWLTQFPTIINEIDILILAHHGSNNGFSTTDFIKSINPKIAISLSNRNNQYEHPHDAVYRRIINNNSKYYSTKDGDIIIESVGEHTAKSTVYNYISNGEVCKDKFSFFSKRSEYYSNK